MARTKKEIFFLVIGLLVSPFVFKGQCDKVKGEEPEYIIFPKAFFSSNAGHVKRFLSNNVLIDDVADKTRKSSQEPPLSPSSDKSTTILDDEKTTGMVSGPKVVPETFTDVVTGRLRMPSQEPRLPLSTDESTSSLSIEEVTSTISTTGVSTETITVHAASGSTLQWHQWNNSYYAFVTSDLTWEDAMERCRSFCGGAHLVFIESDQENREVSRLAVNVTGEHNADWWIGLSDIDEEGSWKWEDVSVTYNNWHDGEPNNGSSYGEDCGVLMSRDGDNALWNDVPCNGMHLFICEKDLKGDT